jgi:FKBP-type peptidyl-prolyl cis-trans isomerase
MTRLPFVLLAIALSVAACDQTASTTSEPATAGPTTEDEKTIYALGVALAQSLTQFNLTEDELELVKSGLTDAASGKETGINLQEYQAKIRDLTTTRAAAIAQKTKQAAAGFLAEMTAKPNAQSFESGLVMIETTAGEGAMPAATDKVTVHYHGTLPDGTVFDSSVDRGTPATFPLNGVIPCWTEGVQKIKVGGKATLVCPSDIAYGDRGRPPTIPPGATLVFDVELISIDGAQ